MHECRVSGAKLLPPSPTPVASFPRKSKQKQTVDKVEINRASRIISIAGYIDNVMNQCFVSRARSEITDECVQVQDRVGCNALHWEPCGVDAGLVLGASSR
jgi:hypothetical protein